MRDDPLADPPPPEECRCRGTGMVQVTEMYVDSLCPAPTEAVLVQLVPDPPADVLLQLPEKDLEKLMADIGLQRDAAAIEINAHRASLLNTWYPCKTHRASAFFRWVNGHWAQDHDPTQCDDCLQRMGKRAARLVAANLHRDDRRDML